MEISEILQAWAPLAPVIFAPLVMALVQRAKARGLDPFIALGGLSVIFAVVYAAIAQYAAPELLAAIGAFLITVGGLANLIYNILKKFYPASVGK